MKGPAFSWRRVAPRWSPLPRCDALAVRNLAGIDVPGAAAMPIHAPVAVS
jgi:hypothetical protein